MAATIRLLGVPAILRDGHDTAGPKGRKAWALLAYLLLAERPATRRALAELLFADAADPLGALRWNLAQLRRALEGIATIEGDPVTVALAPDVSVDAHSPSAGGELLEGIELDTSAAFESWLVVARGRYAGQAATALHEGALDALTDGDADRAAELAAELVAVDPYDEQHHELLVRALVARGDRAGALAQVETCRRLFRRELGREPSVALRQAVAPETASTPATGSRAAALAHLEAAEAAIAAGAAEHGVGVLRQACREAESCGDPELHGRALLALGYALVDAVRGHDEEGALYLHQAVAVAERTDDRPTLVEALRALAFADTLAGRRASIEPRLRRADDLATTSEQRAAILTVLGQHRSDMGNYPGAHDALHGAMDHAERAGNPRRLAMARSLTGRLHVLRGDHEAAIAMLDQALEVIEAERWVAFLPLPASLRGEVEALEGHADRAEERLQRAFALACDLQDPCWEGMAARAMGLLEHRAGRDAAGRSWMDEAYRRCARLPDRYLWIQGHVLDAAISTAVDVGETDRATQLNAALGGLAARAELRELTVRHLVHAAHLGDSGAMASARTLAEDIENPALAALVA